MTLGRSSAAARRRTTGGSVRVAGTELPTRRIYQRATASAAVAVSGTYTGAASAVSARIINAATSAEVVAWTTVAASPAGGTWSGSITVPQGGWYKIQYRLSDEQAAVFTGASIFGVGDIWMFAGEAQQARLSTLVSGSPVPDDRTGYFNGASGWALPGSLAGTGGNGMIRFLNLMVSATNVPQACIQVSVEGTAITDWESGDPAYVTAVSRLTEVGGVAGILWNQGGTGIGTVSREDYKTRLASLFTGLAQTAAVQRFGVFPLMHRTNAADTDIDTQEIRKAHYEHLFANPETVNLGWLPDVSLADDVTQTAAGSEAIAFVYAHALLHKMGIEPVNNLGPVITSASRSGTTVTLAVQHKAGTLLRTRNNLTATGFQVLPRGMSHSDASSIGITNVVLDANAVSLTLASDPASAVDVYYQWGRFDNTAPVFDNASALGSTGGNAVLPLMAPVQTPVEVGQFANPALKFDNDTGHLRYSDGVLWDVPDNDWTFGIWAKLDSNAGTASQYLFSTGAYGATHSFNFLVYESGSGTPDRFEFNIRGGGASAISVQGVSDTAAADTAWRLWIIEFVKASGTINIYYCNVNGPHVLYKSQAITGLGVVQPTTGAAIGTRAPPLSGSQRWLNGSVWSFFKMNNLLSEAEMLSLAAGGDPPLAEIFTKANTLSSPIPNSGVGGNAPAAVVGTVVQAEGPKFSLNTTAIQFDEPGLMTYTMPKSASHNVPDSNWTFGFFASISDNQGTNGQYLWSTGGGLAPHTINIFFWEASTANPNAFGISMEGSSAIDHDIISPSVAALLDGTWRLWTVERNGIVISIFQTPVNGTRQLVYQHTLTGTLGSITPTVPTVTIGGRYSGETPVNRYFGGRLYSAFQMDAAISKTNVESIARGKDPISDLGLPLKWYHRFTDTTSPRTDLSGNGNTATRTAGTPVQVAGPVFIPNA